MPNEIPGKGLGYLPDKGRKGICPECRRSFRTVKVKVIDGVNVYLCPHCEKEIIKRSLKNE